MKKSEEQKTKKFDFNPFAYLSKENHLACKAIDIDKPHDSPIYVLSSAPPYNPYLLINQNQIEN